MKIFGKYGWFWYREMFNMIDNAIYDLQNLKKEYFLLQLHNQLRSEDYSEWVQKSCELEIARLQLLREYLIQRKRK